ncbi:hypothetical protein EDC96DRAFT_549299 [Choanephora cucurbitarum]|nr:hypothetical protein EDC96DRAFT_549299 [Choanephora cucurbitarum]
MSKLCSAYILQVDSVTILLKLAEILFYRMYDFLLAISSLVIINWLSTAGYFVNSMAVWLRFSSALLCCKRSHQVTISLIPLMIIKKAAIICKAIQEFKTIIRFFSSCNA